MLTVAKWILPEVGDWGISVFLVLLVTHLSGVQVEWKHFIWGLLFVILPDLIPNPFWVWSKISSSGNFHGADSHEHREFGHWLILHLLIFSFIWLKWGKMWAALFIVCVAWHIFHDSFGIGHGIKPFAPFSDVTVKLFSDSENRDVFWPPSMQIRWPKEQAQVVKTYGKEDWFSGVYLSWTWISVSEYTAFIFGMVTLWWVKKGK
ncbi:MAG: hypothetical protein PHV93_03330 [Candidatus Pacebacteria bacterium]|nr:hypothetical protein [Candidatus Paceibacterota bacterium]